MKKFFIFLFFITNSYLYSSDFSKFESSDINSIKAFARDIGNVIGGSTLYSARALGFGGFGVSYKGSYQIKPEKNDGVLEKNKVFGINYIQIENGLPYRIDSFLRAGVDDNFNVIGGGLRYGVISVTDELYKPNVIFSLSSHMGLHRDFYIVSYGALVAVSLRITNGIVPFFASGVDSLKLVVKSHTDSNLIDKKIYDKVIRNSFGFRFRYKFLNLSMAYNIYEKRDGFDISGGIRF